MTRIKLCGLRRTCDIIAANRLKPEYIGFVFATKSRRYVTYDKAFELKGLLHADIKSVGVFVNETPDTVAKILKSGVIDIAQLHGHETEDYIKVLRALTDKPLIKAYKVETENDVSAAENSSADYILLDSGSGTGKTFDWELIEKIKRPYFLAGGLCVDNVEEAVKTLSPFAVDVSSGIETNGYKDKNKMAEFVAAVRKGETE